MTQYRVDIVSAASDSELRKVIGAAKAYWTTAHYQFVSEQQLEGGIGVDGMSDAADEPEQWFYDGAETKHRAILIFKA